MFWQTVADLILRLIAYEHRFGISLVKAWKQPNQRQRWKAITISNIFTVYLTDALIPTWGVKFGS